MGLGSRGLDLDWRPKVGNISSKRSSVDEWVPKVLSTIDLKSGKAESTKETARMSRNENGPSRVSSNRDPIAPATKTI